MSGLWTPNGSGNSGKQEQADDLPVVESTLALACGHEAVTTDREALRAVDAVNRGQGHVTVWCGNPLCLTDRRVTHIAPKQQAPEPEPEEWDIERGLYEWEKKHDYRNPATGRRRPEHLGKDFQ